VTLAAVGVLLARPGQAAGVSDADAASGIRAALERGAASAVDLLGRHDGFLGNPKVRIPLPGFLNDAAKLLKFAGQQRRVDELVTAMNRAAESAVPEARTLLVNAVRSMSVEDARRILTKLGRGTERQSTGDKPAHARERGGGGENGGYITCAGHGNLFQNVGDALVQMMVEADLARHARPT